MVKFGDDEAFIINDLDLKTKIIDYLFTVIDLSKYRFNMLDKIAQLNYLKSNEHYVSVNFKGFNYFLLFYKFNNAPHCIAIDKKNLSYHKNLIDIKKVTMFRVKCMVMQSIFRGTLFDMKMIKTKNEHVMLAKDCYMLMGNNIIDMDMNEKMIYLDSIMENQFQKDYCINFKIKINKLYRYNMLEEIVTKIIPKYDIDITGLVFYPKKSGICYIYTDKKDEPVQTTSSIVSCDTYNMIHQITDMLNSRSYAYEKIPKKKSLYVEPTEITDVYNVYDGSEKLGIAHIPNYKTSQYCKMNIKEKTKCVCVYYKPFDKWIPLNIC